MWAAVHIVLLPIKEMSIDLETYSDVDIKKSGVYKYAESENFEILLFAVSINGDDVIVYDLACGDVLPDDDVHYDHGRSIADNIVTLVQLVRIAGGGRCPRRKILVRRSAAVVGRDDTGDHEAQAAAAKGEVEKEVRA